MRRRGQGIFTGEPIYMMLDTILPIAIVLILLLFSLWNFFHFLSKSAALQDARLLASSVSGAISAVAAAPERGVYCVRVPGDYDYQLVIGKVNVAFPPFGGQDGRYTFVTAYSASQKAGGVAYPPVAKVEERAFKLAAGSEHTIVVRKTNPTSQISVDVLDKPIALAGCDKT